VTFTQDLDDVAHVNEHKTLGRDDWRIPTKEELNVPFQNRDKGALQAHIQTHLPLGSRP